MATKCFNDKSRFCHGSNEYKDTPCALFNVASGHCDIMSQLESLLESFEIIYGDPFPFQEVAIDGTKECFMDKNYKCCGSVGNDAEVTGHCDYWWVENNVCIMMVYQMVQSLSLMLLVP